MSKAPATSAMVTVYGADNRCVGFILNRGPEGVELFCAETKSLGLFETMREAAAGATATKQ
jgi:hypothetical protein